MYVSGISPLRGEGFLMSGVHIVALSGLRNQKSRLLPRGMFMLRVLRRD